MVIIMIAIFFKIPLSLNSHKNGNENRNIDLIELWREEN